MDHLVEELFVFEGEGNIRQFNGNYSDYRTWIEEKEEALNRPEPIKSAPAVEQPKKEKSKISFKEKQEYDTLTKEIEVLESKKTALSAKLNEETLDHQQLVNLAKEIESIVQTIETKTNRWIELAELV
jgi:ATP-binding cassette subfamily F protein uup